MKAITNFKGAYAFLSNFHDNGWLIEDAGIVYRTAEHAYQAAKTFNTGDRLAIAAMVTPGQAKQAGKKLEKRPDWDDVKLEVMDRIVRSKFRDETLAAKLLATGDALLVEGNWWHDRFWGECPIGTGENHLGKILMKIREELRKNIS